MAIAQYFMGVGVEDRTHAAALVAKLQAFVTAGTPLSSYFVDAGVENQAQATALLGQLQTFIASPQ